MAIIRIPAVAGTRANVLAALYNCAEAPDGSPHMMSNAEAQQLLDDSPTRQFDRLYGRPMKINLDNPLGVVATDGSGPRLLQIDSRNYDHANGQGSALLALDHLGAFTVTDDAPKLFVPRVASA